VKHASPITMYQEKKPLKQISSTLIRIGLVATAIGLILLLFIYHQVLFNELVYTFSSHGKNTAVISKEDKAPKGKSVIVSEDEDFGIVIPKINANAKVIPDVDPFNSLAYQIALTKGIAHAKGSAYPDQIGNVFLFAHSSANFYEALRYNSVFYLLNKLEKDDDIYIFYKKIKIDYKVTDKLLVNPDQAFYISPVSNRHQLTLMTCWPPGTTLKRLLIIAETDK